MGTTTRRLAFVTASIGCILSLAIALGVTPDIASAEQRPVATHTCGHPPPDIDQDGSGSGQQQCPTPTATPTGGEERLPETVVLFPETANNSTGQQQTLYATVYDQFAQVMPNISVSFRVSGTHIDAGFGKTDVSGVASFVYEGNSQGQDTVLAWVDNDNDGVAQFAEPQDVGQVTWFPPIAECEENPEAICGTNGDDFIQGTEGPDVIYAGDGEDIIHCFGGKDIVFAGNGADYVDCGAGDDTVRGNDGADEIHGDSPPEEGMASPMRVQRAAQTTDGDDILVGGGGRDRIFGYGGRDRIEGGDNPDVIWAAQLIDMIDGGKGGDIVHGEGGDDEIKGFDGSDKLWGEDGDDTLIGGKGDDELYGLDGIDVCIQGPGDGKLHRCEFKRHR